MLSSCNNVGDGNRLATSCSNKTDIVCTTTSSWHATFAMLLISSAAASSIIGGGGGGGGGGGEGGGGGRIFIYLCSQTIKTNDFKMQNTKI